MKNGTKIRRHAMKKAMKQISLFVSAIAGLACLTLAPLPAHAHCDTLGGPVIATARAALDKGDITPLLKWIQKDDEAEIRKAFGMTVQVRKLGAEAKELADMYFFETLVRIHRAGEGAPYTGLKAADAVDPAVALADQALAKGNVDELVQILTNAMTHGIKERFQKAYDAGKHADESVASGRQYVKAYVIFTHYVEGLHGLIKGGAAHHDDSGEHGH